MKGYSSFVLSDSSRNEILNNFPPSFEKVVCHHITYAFGISSNEALPEDAIIEAIGFSKNNQIECLVVEVNGSAQRPDGGTFHITLSHKAEVKPVMSNELIKNNGFTPIARFKINASPKFNPFS